MSTLRFLTAGESHGPSLTAILEGMIAGLPVTAEMIDRDLARRQVAYGAGGADEDRKGQRADHRGRGCRQDHRRANQPGSDQPRLQVMG